MTTLEQELRDALAKFMHAVQVKNKVVVAATLARITELQQQLGADAPPMLRHYLGRRSYQKALDFLNSGQAETDTPQCGH